MFAAVTPHASAFRPVLPGETNSLGSSSPRSGDIGQASGPPHKQRKRPPPLPTVTQKLTCGLLETYRHTNSSFVYVGAIQNPRRVLTKDARPSGNHGMDNKSSDLILTVGDVLVGPNGGHKFRVLDMLGQGTFGQVVKCRAEWDQERDNSSPLSACSPGTSPASSGLDELRSLRKSTPNPQMVAVKIVKNKPAYFNQAKVEIKVLHKVNDELGPGKNPGDPGHSLIRLLYDFEYHHHLCLVFELMSVNLYELIKHQDFRGLPFARVRAFCEQLLDALDCLFRLGVIHCDLKPENILLENFGDPTTPRIKLIDLGSACYHDHVAFTYIQSRFYRAPEVLLGVKYSAPIDLWSLGCVAIELYMGLPVFPGVSAHNQLTRIVEMLGNPPNWMIEEGKKSEAYFTPLSPSREGTADIMEFDMREDYFSTSNQAKWKDGMQLAGDEPSLKKHTSLHWSTSRYGQPPKQETPKWRIKTPHEWAFENGLRDGPEKTKRYVKEKTLPGIILKCESKRRPKNEPVESLSQDDLECFIDFCSGLLRLDPNERWTAAQSMRHPFIRQIRYDGPFVPRESVTPEVVPEETEEDLLFAADEGPADLATDMAEMEMEVDYDEQEELEEEKRRIRTRAAPLAIAKPASTSTSSTQQFTSASASSLTRGKSLGLSSSQQRYKRKLSESNSVAASPQTTASSLTSVMGSPIMRPDVPYPLAHQSRWSDLGVLASPKLGTLGLPYHSILPPSVDQLGVNATPGGASRALSYGSSLPSQRGLMQGQHHLGSTTATNASDVHAFRRLEFQNFAPGGGASGQAAQSLSSSLGGNVAPGQYWTFSGQFPSLQLSPQQPTQNPPSTILSHMSAGMPYSQQHQRRSSLTEQSVDHTRISSSWTGSSGSIAMRMSGEDSDQRNFLPKKRADSEHFISVNTSEALNGGAEPSALLSPNANSVVVERTLEKWAPFNKDEQKKTEEPTQSDKSS